MLNSLTTLQDTEVASVTQDEFLGGKLAILQPAKGYRAGVDAVLLAASIPDINQAVRILDAGSGVGTVGLCIAARIASAYVTLVERDANLAGLARRNLEQNNLRVRVSVIETDVTAAGTQLIKAGIATESFDQVVFNPPFHNAADSTPSPEALKVDAHAMESGSLERWFRFAARALMPNGSVTAIHKADALDEIIAACSNRFGALIIKPVHAFATKPAIRVLVRGIKGSRKPLSIAPPLILHSAPGQFTSDLNAILREGRGLHLIPG